MAKRNNANKEVVDPRQRRIMLTTFILLFPSLLITGWVSFMSNLGTSISAILLFFFQAVLINNFVKDHYGPGIDEE